MQCQICQQSEDMAGSSVYERQLFELPMCLCTECFAAVVIRCDAEATLLAAYRLKELQGYWVRQRANSLDQLFPLSEQVSTAVFVAEQSAGFARRTLMLIVREMRDQHNRESD